MKEIEEIKVRNSKLCTYIRASKEGTYKCNEKKTNKKRKSCQSCVMFENTHNFDKIKEDGEECKIEYCYLNTKSTGYCQKHYKVLYDDKERDKPPRIVEGEYKFPILKERKHVENIMEYVELDDNTQHTVTISDFGMGDVCIKKDMDRLQTISKNVLSNLTHGVKDIDYELFNDSKNNTFLTMFIFLTRCICYEEFEKLAKDILESDNGYIVRNNDDEVRRYLVESLGESSNLQCDYTGKYSLCDENRVDNSVITDEKDKVESDDDYKKVLCSHFKITENELLYRLKKAL